MKYCRKRNLEVSGTKAELVARVFAASEMSIPIEPTLEERMSHTKRERTKLLKMSDRTVLPDPLTLTEGWLRETEGITSWSPIFLSDISVFFMTDHLGKDVDLHERILNGYKEGKAFRLFESGWLKEV